MLIPLSEIVPNAANPRKSFDATELVLLSKSIEVNGLYQPITVRPIKGADAGFEIIMGERRWRAHRLLAERGLTEFAEIEAHVRDLDDRGRDVAAVVENVQRMAVPPLEEARAFKRMLDEGMTREDIAREVGIPMFRVNFRLAVLDLTPENATLLEGGHLELRQAVEISKLQPADQTKVVRMINAGQLVGWRPVQAMVETILGGAAQLGMFADAKAPTREEVSTVRSMEAKVDKVVAMVAAGWSNGQCIIAAKVDPSRAGLMADKLAELAKSIKAMERELRNARSQSAFALGDAA